MKIISMAAENFMRLKAVEITPEGNMVVVSGENGEGKTSLLTAIWVGLVGKSVAPPRPVRAGCEEARIMLDLGELIIHRTFRDNDGKITDTIKVTDPEGRRYPSPQKVLDELLGKIGFDPFAFTLMKPEQQAQTLREMVPLSVDLDELAAADASDTELRRDINRDAAALKAQIEGIAVPVPLPEPIDKAALMDQMAKAAGVNTSIERDRMDRDQRGETILSRKAKVGELTAEIGRMEDRIKVVREEIKMLDKGTAEREKELAGLPPLAEPVDTEALSAEIAKADQVGAILQRAAQRTALIAKFDGLRAKSEALTTALGDRAEKRRLALAEAKMPVDGLGLMGTGKDQLVTFEGVPFVQVNTAEQLRVSTAIAMAANPTLRVLRIKEGSLLSDKTLAILAEQVKDAGFQLWVEMARPGADVGIVIEDGMIKEPDAPSSADPGRSVADYTDQAPKPEPKSKAKPAKADDKPAGSLL